MSAAIEYPTPTGLAATSDFEEGFNAVRGRYGNDMVQRFKNWPILAARYTEAQNGDARMVERAQEEAEKNMVRARQSRDYAMAQAKVIADTMDRVEWAVVPSVNKLRREWGME
jgi:hypothetical protein